MFKNINSGIFIRGVQKKNNIIKQYNNYLILSPGRLIF